MNDLNRCLAKLGLPGPSAVEPISSGMGGSVLYRATLGDEVLIIKFTSPSAGVLVRARAEKEYRFYHELAPLLSIRVPELLSSFKDEDGCALVLRTYQPMSMRSMTAEQYLQVVDIIARLHAEHWGEPSPQHTWLTPNPVDVAPADSLSLWLQLIAEHRLDDDQALPEHLCRSLFVYLPDIEAIISKFPTTLCHGDYHAGNILLNDQGEIVVADWQEVMVGIGPGDLAFLLQRSSPQLLGLSDDAVIQYYVTRLGKWGVHVELTEVARVANACKLRTMLLFWPNYLLGAPREWVERIARGIAAASSALEYC